MHAVCYKYILEMELASGGSKYSISSSNVLDVRYINSVTAYEKYLISGQQDNDQHISVLQLKF